MPVVPREHVSGLQIVIGTAKPIVAREVSSPAERVLFVNFSNRLHVFSFVDWQIQLRLNSVLFKTLIKGTEREIYALQTWSTRFSSQAINQEKAHMHFLHGAAVVSTLQVRIA